MDDKGPDLKRQVQKAIAQAFFESIEAYGKCVKGDVSVKFKDVQIAAKNIELLYNLGCAVGIFSEGETGDGFALLLQEASAELENYEDEDFDE